MNNLNPPIYFKLISPNELELNKIKNICIKTYNYTDNLKTLIKNILKKYKTDLKNILIQDISLIYKGEELNKSLQIKQLNINNKEPIIIFIKNIDTVSLNSTMDLINILFPDNTLENYTSSISNDQDSLFRNNTDRIQTNTNLDNYNKNILINMGFPESLVKTAIANTNNLEEAIDILIGKSS